MWVHGKKINGSKSALFASCVLSLSINMAIHSLKPQTVYLQSYWLIFPINPLWFARKYIFRYKICHFSLILAFFKQKVPKNGERMLLFKVKYHIWTHHAQFPLWTPFASYYLRKRFSALDCTHIVLVMWPDTQECWSSWKFNNHCSDQVVRQVMMIGFAFNMRR